MLKLEKITRTILTKCLQLQKEECCLIVADENRRQFGQMLHKVVHQFGAYPVYIEVVSPKRYGYEPPRAITEAMKQADAVVIATEFPINHKQARTTGNKTRILSLSTVDPDTICRMICANYERINERTKKLADIFTIGKRIKLTTPAGTNLTMSISSVKGKVNTGIACQKGQFSSLPGGEAYTPPVSGTTQGKVVIDMSLDFIGKLTTPITLVVKNGTIAKISGKHEADKLRKLIKPFGQNARKLVGIGVGTNDKAKPGISIGEDKKVIGAVHITFGNNIAYDKSGRRPARIDGVLRNSTLVIDGMVIIENGKTPIFAL